MIGALGFEEAVVGDRSQQKNMKKFTCKARVAVLIESWPIVMCRDTIGHEAGLATPTADLNRAKRKA